MSNDARASRTRAIGAYRYPYRVRTNGVDSVMGIDILHADVRSGQRVRHINQLAARVARNIEKCNVPRGSASGVRQTWQCGATASFNLQIGQAGVAAAAEASPLSI